MESPFSIHIHADLGVRCFIPVSKVANSRYKQSFYCSSDLNVGVLDVTDNVVKENYMSQPGSGR